MADDNLPQENEPKVDLEAIDSKVHRRLLGFLNAARSPEDLFVAPNDRRFVNEEQAHTDLVEEEPKEREVMGREFALDILEARDRVSPVHGFAHLRDLLELKPGIVAILPGPP